MKVLQIIATSLVLALVMTIVKCQLDLTMQANAKGSAVVKAVVDKIHESCIFLDDKQLLRRIAWVESKDGNDANTYRAGYGGIGIWQVDCDTGFAETQRRYSASSSKYSGILQKFSINWSTLTCQDLLKPLYSGLAARLLLSFKTEAIPRSVSAQATYWKTHYNTAAGNGTAQKFIDDVSQITSGCSLGKADIVFVLDSSGSVGSSNFDQMRTFVSTVVDALDVGITGIHVGVVRYENSATIVQQLGNYTRSSVLSSIRTMRYSGGGTQTDRAIDLMVSMFDAYGRPTTSGIPNIAIVVTDGQSNDQSATILAANRMHRKNITAFAIGVGSGFSTTELNAIATAPDCVHVFDLAGFSDFTDFKTEIEERTCKVTTQTDVGTEIRGELKHGQQQLYTFQMTEKGLSLKLDVQVGSVYMYASLTVESPSEAVYDYKITSGGKSLYIPPPAQSLRKRRATTSTNTTTPVYTALVGKTNGTKSSFVLKADHGNIYTLMGHSGQNWPKPALYLIMFLIAINFL